MYSICTNMEGDMGSTCTVYCFILAVKNFCEFCDSLDLVFICENLFCENCCHATPFYMSTWVICENTSLQKILDHFRKNISPPK